MKFFSRKKGDGAAGTAKSEGTSNGASSVGSSSNSGSSKVSHVRSGPGAMNVSSNTSVFRVTVPDGIEPGQEFSVYAGQRVVRVRCPPNSRPGQSLQITVPITPDPGANNGNINAPNSNSNPGIPPDSPNVTKLPRDPDSTAPQAYMVEILPGIRGGQQFPVTIAGQQLMVTCPRNARPGHKVRIVPPPPPTNVTEAPTTAATNQQDNNGNNSRMSHLQQEQRQGNSSTSPQQSSNGDASNPSRNTNSSNSNGHKDGSSSSDEPTQLFEVQVPPGVQPGKPFALLAGGVRVLVTCPWNALPGQRIRFKVPLALTQKPQATSETAQIKLSYDKDGWMRTIRLSDRKFVWVRMNDQGDVDEDEVNDGKNTVFRLDKSAYVRHLEFRPGADERLRDGILTLVPASRAVVDSKIKLEDGREIVSYSDIANAQVKSFEEKAQWFQDKCSQMFVEWNNGHMRLIVRRDHLLEDSVDAIMSLSRADLRKWWRFEFIGEMGIDAGGLAREWFQLVTQEMFDPDRGFWQCSETNQMSMQINPAAEFIHDEYLIYYRFLGRVMGRALFDRHLVAGHCVQYIYKHMLGWPIQFKDIQSIDEEYYQNLKQLQDLVNNGEDLSALCLDFTTQQDMMGVMEEVELVPGGKNMEVTNDNFPQYLEACLKYRVLERVKPQLNELLLGFYDVIPEPVLTVFDFQELELLMCGLPVIDIDDWQAHTEYSGDYEHEGADASACQWFWQVVAEDFDQEMKARLLQFVTGTSGVPSRGFGVLQSNDGNVRKFTIHGVSVGVCLYPRAHTCFNRIDLPSYDSKEELREKLKLAVTMVATGFDIE